MAETKRKGRKRNHISSRQQVESARAFAQHIKSGGLKADLERIKVIHREIE